MSTFYTEPTTGTQIATDVVGSDRYQIMKLDGGYLGASQPITGTTRYGLAADITRTVPATDISTSGTISATGQVVTLALDGCSDLAVQVTGTWTGSIFVEGSLDGTTYSFMYVWYDNGIDLTSYLQSNEVGHVGVAGLKSVRVAVQSWSTGTANVFMRASAGTSVLKSPGFLPTNFNTIGRVGQAILGETWIVSGGASIGSPLPPGNNNIGDVDVASTVPSYDLSTSGTITSTGSVVAFGPLHGCSNATVTISGNWELGSSQLTIEGSGDGTNWYSVEGYSHTSLSTLENAAYIFNSNDVVTVEAAGFQYLRILPAEGYPWSGTAVIIWRASPALNGVVLMAPLPHGSVRIGGVFQSSDPNTGNNTWRVSGGVSVDHAVPSSDRITTGSISGSGQSVQLDTQGCSTASFTLSGTWTGTIDIQGSNTGDVNDWTTIFPYVYDNGFFLLDFSPTANGTWSINCSTYRYIRLHSSSWSTGTSYVTLRSTVGNNFMVVVPPDKSGINWSGGLFVAGAIDNGGDVSPLRQDGSGNLQTVFSDYYSSSIANSSNQNVIGLGPGISRTGATISVSGNWSGTILVSGEVKYLTGPDTRVLNVYNTALDTWATSITSNGLYLVPLAGIDRFFIGTTVWTSGQALVSFALTTFSNVTYTRAGQGIGNAGASPWAVSGSVSVTQNTSPWVVSGGVSLGSPIPPGANIIGKVSQDTSPWIISGGVTVSNFPATQAVTQSTTPWITSGGVSIGSPIPPGSNSIGSVAINNTPFVSASGVVSIGNSSTTTIAASGTFTGAWEDVSNYTKIVVSIFSDLPSETNPSSPGLMFDFSSDGVNIDYTDVDTYASGSIVFGTVAGIGSSYQLVPKAKYFRIRYKNTITAAQTVFRLQTIYDNGDVVLEDQFRYGIINDNISTWRVYPKGYGTTIVNINGAFTGTITFLAATAPGSTTFAITAYNPDTGTYVTQTTAGGTFIFPTAAVSYLRFGAVGWVGGAGSVVTLRAHFSPAPYFSNIIGSLPAGTNIIGSVMQDGGNGGSSPWSVSGTVNQGTSPWIISGGVSIGGPIGQTESSGSVSVVLANDQPLVGDRVLLIDGSYVTLVYDPKVRRELSEVVLLLRELIDEIKK